jgi:arsenate reductase
MQTTTHPQPPSAIDGKQRVLILCTGNSARSQMAEGLLRALAGERYDVYSAGSKPSVVNPLAIAAMAERGIDISAQRSKHLREYLETPFDYVITVCDQAAETCPFFPGRAERIHWSFPDPATATGTQAERLATFRESRDAIETRFRAWLAETSVAISPGPST